MPKHARVGWEGDDSSQTKRQRKLLQHKQAEAQRRERLSQQFEILADMCNTTKSTRSSIMAGAITLLQELSRKNAELVALVNRKKASGDESPGTSRPRPRSPSAASISSNSNSTASSGGHSPDDNNADNADGSYDKEAGRDGWPGRVDQDVASMAQQMNIPLTGQALLNQVMQSRLDALQVPVDPRLENFPKAIGRMDVTGRLLDCNRAFSALLRYPKLALLSSGSTIFQLVAPSDMLKAFHFFQQTVASGVSEFSKAQHDNKSKDAESSLAALASKMAEPRPDFVSQTLIFNTGESMVCHMNCTAWLASDKTFGNFIFLVLEPEDKESRGHHRSPLLSGVGMPRLPNSTFPNQLNAAVTGKPSLQFPMPFANNDANPGAFNSVASQPDSASCSSSRTASSSRSSGRQDSPHRTGGVAVKTQLQSPVATYPKHVDFRALLTLTAASSSSDAEAGQQQQSNNTKFEQQQQQLLTKQRDEQALLRMQAVRSKNPSNNPSRSASGSGSETTNTNSGNEEI